MGRWGEAGMIELNEVATVADISRVQAQRRPDAAALIFEGRETSFGEIDAAASRIANQLIASGITPQERIGYLAKNSDHFFEFLFGACKARVALAPINFRLAAPELAEIIADSGARLLIVGAEFVELAEKALDLLASRPRLIALGFDREGYLRHDVWVAAAEARDPRLAIEPDDDVIQLYTSGTTGQPKGVQLTNRNYLSIFQLVAHSEGLKYDVGETVLGAMPFFHVAGVNIALIAMASGARTAVVKDLFPDLVLDLVETERVAYAFLAPAIILMLMHAPRMATADLSSMKVLSYGASPISDDLLLKAKARFKCDFVQFYGMTETTGVGTLLRPEAHDPGRGKLRSCGLAWPGVEVKIVDAKGEGVPPGAVGEVVVKSPVVMKGYWNKPEATAAAVRDGWMHTGDAAWRDEEGYFYIYDRVKDMIVTGGENVYPAEVENAIAGHPDVADVAVIGVPDERWGEAVKAIVVARPGAARDPSGVIAWSRERIANYKVPKSVDFVEAIPRNITGKILRRELRKAYWEGRDRMVG
jgi:acyl-CoA synthetase (AMP-forming)/AMP-acid ligase II